MPDKNLDPNKQPSKDDMKKMKDLPVGTGQIAKLTKVPSSELPSFGKQKSRSSSSRFLDSGGPKEKLERLPPLRSTPPNQLLHNFISKIRQCRVVFDFTKPLSDVNQKDIKQDALLELVDFVINARGYFSQIVYKEITEMLALNLFRPLPPHINPNGAQYDPEEDEPILEEAWPHIHIVYELFLRFLDSQDFNISYAKQYFTKPFVINIIELFGSEDPRERDYLKTILHRIYGKFLPLRLFIRKSMRNVFMEFVYDSDRANGICEMLEILASIVNGFSLPLKEEHTEFLMKALMPLHTPKSLSLYHPQLIACVLQYVDKDKSLIQPVIKRMLRYWPVVNSIKEVLFLSELEEILAIIDTVSFEQIMVIVFKRYAKCIESSHFQVSERTFSFWGRENIYHLVSKNMHVIFPIIFESLYCAAKCHWHKVIRSMSCYSLKMFKDMNQEVFNSTVNQYHQRYLDEISLNTKIDEQENKTKTKEVKKLRRKSLLPIDKLTIEAMVEYVQDRQNPPQPPQDLDYDYDETDSDIDWQSDSYSSGSISDSN